MGRTQELIDISHFLEQLEIDLIELDHRLYAVLEGLKSEPRLFDSYESICKGLGRSKIVLGYRCRSIVSIQQRGWAPAPVSIEP